MITFDLLSPRQQLVQIITASTTAHTTLSEEFTIRDDDGESGSRPVLSTKANSPLTILCMFQQVVPCPDSINRPLNSRFTVRFMPNVRM